MNPRKNYYVSEFRVYIKYYHGIVEEKKKPRFRGNVEIILNK